MLVYSRSPPQNAPSRFQPNKCSATGRSRKVILKIRFAKKIGEKAMREARDSSTANRGHAHHRLIKRCSAREGRPRCFEGTQRGSGTGNDSSSCIVQQ